MQKFKKLISSSYMMIIICSLKMAIYYSLIKVKQLEIVLIIMSAFVLIFLFMGFTRLKTEKKAILFIVIYSLFSLLMFADVMYYNYYNDTVSINQLFQVSKIMAVPKSFIATLIPASFLLFLDIPFIYIIFKKNMYKEKEITLDKKTRICLITLVIFISIINLNPFKSIIISKLTRNEFFSNHIYDVYSAIATRLKINTASADEIIEVISSSDKKVNNPRYKGIAKEKNLIVIQVEAFQNFVINKNYNGQEITPNLNRLIKGDSLYFSNYFFNVGKGNTADAEFSSLNSLYPVIHGEAYRIYGDNTFKGLPLFLKEKSYDTYAFHGYKREFWSRDKAYVQQGFDHFYGLEDLDQSEIIGMGISDKSLYHQLLDKVKDCENNFFAFVVSLTSHHPFEIEEEYKTLELKEEDIGTKFGNYLESIRYADEAIAELINKLKENDLYENTVIAIYGDHHGLNCSMDDVNIQMDEFLNKKYDYDEMFNVPLIIHIPSSNIQEEISRVGGQIDFLPTIANLMDIEIDHPYILGQDLLNAKKGIVGFTSYLGEGSFVCDNIFFEISREGLFEDSRAWRIGTNEEVDYNQYLLEYNEIIKKKQISEDILNGDLIKEFYNK